MAKYENIAFKYKRPGAKSLLNMKVHTQAVFMSRVVCETFVCIKHFVIRDTIVLTLSTQLTSLQNAPLYPFSLKPANNGYFVYPILHKIESQLNYVVM